MKPSAYISDGGILFKESPPDSILKLTPLYTSAEIQTLHNLVEEQEKKIIYNNAVGVPNPDGWELTTDSSDVATWKAYEEVRFNPDLIHRWVREGDEYVNRMTKEQMEALKQQLELAEWDEETWKKFKKDNYEVIEFKHFKESE
jgi:hypothetical protein